MNKKTIHEIEAVVDQVAQDVLSDYEIDSFGDCWSDEIRDIKTRMEKAEDDGAFCDLIEDLRYEFELEARSILESLEYDSAIDYAETVTSAKSIERCDDNLRTTIKGDPNRNALRAKAKKMNEKMRDAIVLAYLDQLKEDKKRFYNITYKNYEPHKRAIIHAAASSCGYTIVNPYTDKGYQVPDNCLWYSNGSCPNSRIFIKIELDETKKTYGIEKLFYSCSALKTKDPCLGSDPVLISEFETLDSARERFEELKEGITKENDREGYSLIENEYINGTITNTTILDECNSYKFIEERDRRIENAFLGLIGEDHQRQNVWYLIDDDGETLVKVYENCDEVKLNHPMGYCGSICEDVLLYGFDVVKVYSKYFTAVAIAHDYSRQQEIMKADDILQVLDYLKIDVEDFGKILHDYDCLTYLTENETYDGFFGRE